MTSDDDKPTAPMTLLLGGVVIVGMIILALAVVGVLHLLRGCSKDVGKPALEAGGVPPVQIGVTYRRVFSTHYVPIATNYQEAPNALFVPVWKGPQ